MKVAKILLNIASVFCFIYFALYIFTLVFIPLGVYCFLAGKRFAYKAENLDDIIFVPNKAFKGYVIYASIFCFPFGLLSIIPYVLLTSNRIKVTDYKYTYTRSDVSAIETERESEVAEPEVDGKMVDAEQSNTSARGEAAEQAKTSAATGAETKATAAETKTTGSAANVTADAKATGAEQSKTAEQTAEQKEETEAEKLEKFKKLENFKEKGLITEEELEQAREQLFGKKN